MQHFSFLHVFIETFKRQKMKNLKFTVVTLAILAMSAGLNAQRWQSVRGDHNVVSKERKAGSFPGIRVSSGIDVYLTQGDKESIRVEADGNLHEYIITEVRNGILHVYSEANIRDAESKKAYVTMKDIYSITTTSAGDVVGETPIKAERLDLSASSAGNINLEIEAVEVEVDISSSGDITLRGEADFLDANLSSAGDLNASELQVREAEVSASSAGDADVNVTERINARASSAGDISYRGNPKFVNLHSSSAGGIRRR
jgi:hypothetical protein